MGAQARGDGQQARVGPWAGGRRTRPGIRSVSSSTLRRFECVLEGIFGRPKATPLSHNTGGLVLPPMPSVGQLHHAPPHASRTPRQRLSRERVEAKVISPEAPTVTSPSPIRRGVLQTDTILSVATDENLAPVLGGGR